MRGLFRCVRGGRGVVQDSGVEGKPMNTSRSCDLCGGAAHARYTWGTCGQSHEFCQTCGDELWGQSKAAVAANCYPFTITPIGAMQEKQ